MAFMEIKIETPTVPNFLRLNIPDQKSRPGDDASTLIPLSSLTDEQLTQVAKEWTKELFERANNQRNPKDRETKR